MGKIRSFIKTLGVLLFRRALPMLTFAILFGVAAVQIDRWQVNNAPASDFINYTAFNVNNARAGEDVYFNVCRDHKENYVYAGALTVYIYRDVDPRGTQTKVYAKDIGGSIRTECENKVLRASDFRHTAGTYKMAFCVNFNVKYNIAKTACKESNIYKIYPQPTDIQDQLKYYQDQIDILNRQMSNEGAANAAGSNDMSLKVPEGEARQPSNIGTPGATQTPPSNQQSGNGATGGNTATNPPPATQQPCGVNLGIGLFCGSDGLIRL